MNHKMIFNTPVNTGSYTDFLDEIFYLVNHKIKSYICFANVHMIMEAHTDKTFQDIINNASIVAPDGKPLSIFMRLFYGIKQDRVCGMDIMPDILKQAEANGKSVYFYGTTDELLECISEKALKEFPLLKIAGYYSPPFRNLSGQEDLEIISKINEAAPDLILIALGCPKQERWVAEHKDKFNACLLALGQAFKVYAGQEKRLPSWMRNLSLEWVYRLYLEPGRLWKRYAYTNSYFLLLCIKYGGAQFYKNYFSFMGKSTLQSNLLKQREE